MSRASIFGQAVSNSGRLVGARKRSRKQVRAGQVEKMEPRLLLAATGYIGGEPAAYDLTYYVNGAYTGTETGSSTQPFNTIAEAITPAINQMKAGRSVHVAIAPGIYRESLPDVSSGWNAQSPSTNMDPLLQNAWFRVDRWGSSGNVVIDGADDWSVGKGEGGAWTAVAGQSNVYSRTWDRNWGLWAGGRGTSNIADTPGHRREMVFIDYNDGKGWQRLDQKLLETYTYSKKPDSGPDSWYGAGYWTYTGYAGLGTLTGGSFGITELSTNAADHPANNSNDYQEGRTYIGSEDKTLRQSFKEIYDAASSKAPAAEANKLFIKLPPGVNINDVKIAVTTRNRAWAIEGKKNLVLKDLTFEHFAGRFEADPALRLGRGAFDYYLTSENILLDNVKVRQNNGPGLSAGGIRQMTIQNSQFDNNGAMGAYIVYSHDFKIANSTVSSNLWRTEVMGQGSGFISAGIKTLKVTGVQVDDTQFINNPAKAWYSDIEIANADFNRCTFENNKLGVMLEITHGPVKFDSCTFVGNTHGIELVSSENVSINKTDFINNQRSIILATDGRTYDVVTLPANPAFGAEMLGTADPDGINVDNFRLSNSRFVSNRFGARFIDTSYNYTNYNKYIEEVRETGALLNNKYFASNSEFPFLDRIGTSTMRYTNFAGWDASVDETGSSWDPTLASLTTTYAPARPDYAVGFTWNRRTDWEADGLKSIYDEQWFKDAKGTPTWFHATTRGTLSNAKLTDTTPWYRTPLDYMFVNSVDSSRRDKVVYLHPVYAGNVDKNSIGISGWPADWSNGSAVSVWHNPTGKAATISLSGSLTVNWTGSNASNIDVAIFLWKADGTKVALQTATVSKPGTGGAVVNVNLSNISVGVNDRIAISGYFHTTGQWTSEANIADDLTYTLTSIESGGDTTAPAVVNNTGTSVTQGVSGTVITSSMLKYTDNVSAAAAVTYTVTTLPGKGTLKKSGTALALNGTFTQDDLDNSRITYDNTSNSGNDSFSFTVRDAASNASSSATFSITVNKLAVPGSFTLTAGDGKLTVSWATVTNATGYKIKHGTTSGSYTTTVDITGGSTTSRDITSLTNGTTYYVIMTAYNAAGEGNATAESSKAPTAVVGASLISNGKSATASSQESTSHVPGNAFDGSLSSRWASQSSDNQWIYVDLGSSYNVSRIRLFWETAAGKDYKLQIKAADPGVDTGWTDLKSVTGNTTANSWLDYTGLSGTGRYVRMRGTARATGWGYSLFEFEVYGTAAVVVTAPTLTNAGFESERFWSGGSATGWTQTGGSFVVQSASTFDTRPTGVEGSNVASLTNGTIETSAANRGSVTAGASYTLSFKAGSWYTRSTAITNVTVSLVWYDDNGNAVGTATSYNPTIAPITATGQSLQSFNFTGTAPTGATKVGIRVTVGAGTNPLFDAFQIAVA